MELQIQDLVTSIRKEGVEAARKEADAIIAQAKERAAAIEEEAKAQAAKTLEDASRETNSIGLAGSMTGGATVMPSSPGKRKRPTYRMILLTKLKSILLLCPGAAETFHYHLRGRIYLL